MSNIIVMAFSPRNIIGYLLKKGLQRRGHGHPRSPLREGTFFIGVGGSGYFRKFLQKKSWPSHFPEWINA